MPPKRKQKDYLIVLVGVGGTHKTKHINEKSFLDKSKEVMKHLIQRKIFLRPKDEVGIIVMGASQTKNRLSCDNIVEMDSLQIPTWDLIEKITNLQGTDEKTSWLAGLNVLLHYTESECVEANATKTVVLLTDFQEDPNVIEQCDIETIVADITAANIRLIAICDKSLTGDSQIALNPSEEIFATICNEVPGSECMTFDDSLPDLMIYKDKSKNPMPWKVDMDLYDINIPIIMYLKTTEDFKGLKWQLYMDRGTSKVPVERSRALVDKNREEISPEDIVTGYMYGRKFIPFSDDDKAALQYQSGPKGFMIHSFTKLKNITMDCLTGKGAYVVVPALEWASPFYSLVKSMANQGKVAIVRRVYRENVVPKMGVLVPKLDVPGHPWCLVYVELVFADDRRVVQVKPIQATINKLSHKQKTSIDNLIDAMMLAEVKDDSTNEITEAFEAGTVPDISRQVVWDRLTHRALNPDAPLAPISDFLNNLLEPPRSVKFKSKPVLRYIRELFPINTVQKKNFKKKSHYVPADIMRNQEENEELQYSDRSEHDTSSETENNTQRMETEDEELCHIAEAAEAASRGMDIDLEEFSKDL